MQLGPRVVCSISACGRRAVCPVAVPPRPSPPPVIAPTQPSARASVLTCAKRGNRRPQSDASGSDDGEGASATEDDEADVSGSKASQRQPDDIAAVTDGLAEAAGVERSASQGSDGLESEPSTSYVAGSAPGASKKPMSTVITLTEYTMLMDAKAAKEKEVADRKEKEAREAAGGAALTVPEISPLDASRQGFQAFALDGGDLELLVAETADGRLVLADSYLAAKPAGEGAGESAQQYSRPKLEGEVPDEPLLFQVIPWVERGGSDTFKRKTATNKVKKVYFIGLDAPLEDGGMEGPVFDLDSVFVFDGRTRTLARSEVRMVGNPPLVEPVLRIRPSGITLEDSYLLPDPIEVSMDTALDLADMSEEELAQRLEELERSAESLDEFDEMPDVPSVDMM